MVLLRPVLCRQLWRHLSVGVILISAAASASTLSPLGPLSPLLPPRTAASEAAPSGEAGAPGGETAPSRDVDAPLPSNQGETAPSRDDVPLPSNQGETAPSRDDVPARLLPPATTSNQGAPVLPAQTSLLLARDILLRYALPGAKQCTPTNAKWVFPEMMLDVVGPVVVAELDPANSLRKAYNNHRRWEGLGGLRGIEIDPVLRDLQRNALTVKLWRRAQLMLHPDRQRGGSEVGTSRSRDRRFPACDPRHVVQISSSTNSNSKKIVVLHRSSASCYHVLVWGGLQSRGRCHQSWEGAYPFFAISGPSRRLCVGERVSSVVGRAPQLHRLGACALSSKATIKTFRARQSRTFSEAVRRRFGRIRRVRLFFLQEQSTRTRN